MTYRWICRCSKIASVELVGIAMILNSYCIIQILQQADLSRWYHARWYASYLFKMFLTTYFKWSSRFIRFSSIVCYMCPLTHSSSVFKTLFACCELFYYMSVPSRQSLMNQWFALTLHVGSLFIDVANQTNG